MKPPYRKSWAGNLLMWLDLTLSPSQTRTAKLRRVYNSLIIDPRGLQCETNLHDIVGWESSDVRFDLWPPPSRSNNGSLALVSCLSGGYRFALVLRCVGLVLLANALMSSRLDCCNSLFISLADFELRILQ